MSAHSHPGGIPPVPLAFRTIWNAPEMPSVWVPSADVATTLMCPAPSGLGACHAQDRRSGPRLLHSPMADHGPLACCEKNTSNRAILASDPVGIQRIQYGALTWTRSP